jgi:hypothetical protein
MSEKKTETKTTKSSKAPKKAEAKVKREKAPKEDLCVFALRMTEPERVALHKAAGPAQASRVMRSLAVAFTNEDDAAFKTLLAEAKQLRA